MYLKYKYCLFSLAKLNKFNTFLDLGDNSRTLLVILVFSLIRYPSTIVALLLVCTTHLFIYGFMHQTHYPLVLIPYAALFYPTVMSPSLC